MSGPETPMYPIVTSHHEAAHGLDFLGNLGRRIVVICVMHDYVISVGVHLTHVSLCCISQKQFVVNCSGVLPRHTTDCCALSQAGPDLLPENEDFHTPTTRCNYKHAMLKAR